MGIFLQTLTYRVTECSGRFRPYALPQKVLNRKDHTMSKVCAHIQLGPWNRSQMFCDSVKEAVSFFRDEIACVDFGTGTEDQVMNIYKVDDFNCGCDSAMNFHDYPDARYVVGPRGGIKKH